MKNKEKIIISLTVAFLILVTLVFGEDFLTDMAYPEFNEKNTYRKVMEQQACFDAGGIWWLHETSECGFKK